MFFLAICMLIPQFHGIADAYYLVNGTRHLETCDSMSVCNVIYDRYWMADEVEKMCECPEGSVCPTMYSNPNDEYSLHINSRTQIKFCEPIDSLQKCERNQLAITIKRVYHLDNLQNETTVLHCLCDNRTYWKFNMSYGDYLDQDKALIEISEDYICSDLARCTPRQLCGFARSDYGFIFLRCSCPMYHKCGYDPDDDNEEDEDVIQELFYNGLAYKARCIPTEEFY